MPDSSDPETDISAPTPSMMPPTIASVGVSENATLPAVARGAGANWSDVQLTTPMMMKFVDR